MKNFNYDELYGMDLNEYCEKHSIDIDFLIKKVELDLHILKKRLREVYTKEDLVMSDLALDVYDLIAKKETHLERLKDWKSAL